MKRGILPLVLVTGLLGAGVVAAQRHPGPVPTAASTTTLPISVATPVTVCPGPETLTVPPGGTPLTPSGPVVVSGVLSRTVTATAADAGAPGGTLAPLVPSDDGGARTAAARGVPLQAGAAGVSLGTRTLTTAGGVRLDVAHAAAQPGAARPGAGPALQPAVAAAVQVSLGRSGELRGLAATTCGTATSDVWLVGGGTDTGQRARLLLTNPTPSPALLDVLVHGPKGPVTAPGGQGVVVPAGGEVALFVEALAPGVPVMALHVSARSGRFVATLHDTLVRGVTTGGVDDIGASAPPATRQMLTGLVYVSPGTAAVRVAVPGTTDGVVRVRLTGKDGVVDLPGGVATVPAGGVVDLPVSGVDDGTYSAVVESDVPVVAGAVTSRTVVGGEIAGTPEALGKTVPPSERAWVTSGQALRGAVALSVPALPTVSGIGPVSASLVLSTAQGDARFSLREVGVDGTVGVAREMTMDGDHTVVVPLRTSTSAVLVTPPGEPGTGGPLYAALLLQTSDTAGPMLSVVPVQPGPRPLGAPPTVFEDVRVGESAR